MNVTMKMSEYNALIDKIDMLELELAQGMAAINVYKPSSMSSYKLIDQVDNLSIYKWDNGRDEKFTAWFSKDFDDRIEVDDKDLLIRAIKHERFMQANKAT